MTTREYPTQNPASYIPHTCKLRTPDPNISASIAGSTLASPGKEAFAVGVTYLCKQLEQNCGLSQSRLDAWNRLHAGALYERSDEVTGRLMKGFSRLRSEKCCLQTKSQQQTSSVLVSSFSSPTTIHSLQTITNITNIMTRGLHRMSTILLPWNYRQRTSAFLLSARCQVQFTHNGRRAPALR